MLKRLPTLLGLAALLLLTGCSALSLAYNQLPWLGSLWVDGYLDLDSAQRGRLKAQLATLQAWHRREELPQWQALLKQARDALEGGVTQEELLALERGTRASAQRTLQQAAPLAAPLLAELRPEQWQHLQNKLDERTAEWRDKQSGSDGPGERASNYESSLERWLGELDRTTLKAARAQAQAWPFDLAAMSQGRALRQARTLEALRAWARQDLAAGHELLMQALQPMPTELPQREQAIVSVLKLLNGLGAGQREAVRRHWRGWDAELRALQ